MKKVKIGIIGVGNIGTAHASSIYNGEIEGLELTALCDIDQERLKTLGEDFPKVLLFDNSEELIKSKVVDAVIIATPHYFHPQISQMSLENGLHTLTEKPIGVYTKGLDSVIKAQGDKLYAIMLNQRTNKLYKKAKELIEQGAIGKITRNVWIITNWYRTQQYYDSGSWRGSWQGEGGGVLMNQAPHNLDLWQWICGMPKRVKAIVNEGKYHNIEVEDEATIYAEYENGASGVFIASTGDKYGTNRFEITGTEGKIILEKETLVLENEKEKIIITDEPYNGHKNILGNFAKAILINEPLIAPASDGVNQLRICNGAYLSSWTGDWVNMDFDEDEYLNRLKNKIQGSQNQKKCQENCLFEKTYNNRWTTKW